ncbi:MAG: MliC family protein, partial [Anaerolineae bacterium]|nr:MliC family protein [Anaerolineae bacterium]
QVESADGAKYSSGTIIFWNKGDEATVEVDGKPVYQNCTTQPAGDSSEAPATDTIEATFVCPDGTSLNTVFDNSAHTVTVTMPQG